MINMTSAGNIPVLILAGGKGTRLRDVLKDVPKALAPVSGKPFLAHLLDKLARESFKRIILCAGYQSELICGLLGEKYKDLTLQYSVESTPLGTGGALRLALPYIQSSLCLVMNGDSFVDLDLNDFIAWHNHRKVHGSILLTKVEDASRYGTVEVGLDEHILQFREKSAISGPGWINSGNYLLTQELIASIPPGQVSLEYEIFPRWIRMGLDGMKTTASFIDIGTPESLTLAERFFEMEQHYK